LNPISEKTSSARKRLKTLFRCMQHFGVSQLGRKIFFITGQLYHKWLTDDVTLSFFYVKSHKKTR